MKKAIVISSAVFVITLSCEYTTAGGGCPPEDVLKTNLKNVINRDFSIDHIKPMESMKEICEVVLKIGLKPVVIYTNREGKNIIIGNAFNLETQENLTQKTAEKFSTVPEDVLKKLESHVNMVEGKGEKYVYYISDPDCPFCQRFSPVLKEWASKNNVQIKVILYPLPIHPEAKPKSIAMICDGKGYNDIHTYTDTKNQCEEGKRAIENNIKLLQEIGVTGTPTIIGMNGKYIVGLPRTPEELNTLVQ
jgi:thiol:disulfide interchange protein DsbC